MAITPFSDLGNYGVDPWSGITQNERPWYDPLLRDIYLRESVYSQHVTMKVEMDGPGTPKARTIYFNDLIPPRPNIAAINGREMNATRLYQDSYQRSVQTERYGNGMSVHRESNMFNYWERFGREAALELLIQQSLGQVITDHLDSLARNEFFRHPDRVMGLGSATGFGQLSTSNDKMTTDLVDQVWLALQDRQKPFTALPQGYITGEETLCITTSGAIYDLKREVGTGTGGLNFVDINKYTSEGRAQLYSGELGMYRGIRFIRSPFAKLWNVGQNSVFTTVKAAIKPGDGAPDPTTTKVEGVRAVGQPGATHWIIVNDAGTIQANDKITIYKDKHDSSSVTAYLGKGVVNGPKFDDPMAQDVEVHSVDKTGGVGAHKIVLKEPYMMTDASGKGLETDLGSSVYGYVALGQTVATALFLNPGLAANALIAGVAQSPEIYTPPAFDDYLSVRRVAYDFWMKYQQWDPRSYQLYYLTGANSQYGKNIFR